MLISRPIRNLSHVIVTVFLVLASPVLAFAETITVHKTPWCGCCKHWVSHLIDSGFEVVIKETDDLAPVRSSLGVPAALTSCHTAEVGGYVVEGHVPAAEIKRLLAERPKAKGLSVPGMPLGSPGMETSHAPDQYDVVLFSENGVTRFATYVGAKLVPLAEE